MEVLFSSLDGGWALRARILETISEAAGLAKSNKIDIHVMTFAFTDVEIAAELSRLTTNSPEITVRILADWSQHRQTRGRQVGQLAELGKPNLRVRYKYDQPYCWDASAGCARWSYHTSRGLLHHKTLMVLVNGRPWRLICGSFNWTSTAARSYENLMVIAPECCDSRELMSCVELEFEAIWSDGRASLSPLEAGLHYTAIIEEYRRNSSIPPSEVRGLSKGQGEPIEILHPECVPQGFGAAQPGAEQLRSSRVLIAFSSQDPDDCTSYGGQARSNRSRRFLLRTASGKTKCVPLTITNLGLDTIFRAKCGDTLRLAMYGLSTRVPEYGALLDAARRGAHLQVLLDGAVASKTSRCLRLVSRRERLDIRVCTVGRMMHQKYFVDSESGDVLIGTANFSTDASKRHLEHRIRVSDDMRLTAKFCADFDVIWERASRAGKCDCGDRATDGL